MCSHANMHAVMRRGRIPVRTQREVDEPDLATAALPLSPEQATPGASSGDVTKRQRDRDGGRDGARDVDRDRGRSQSVEPGAAGDRERGGGSGSSGSSAILSGRAALLLWNCDRRLLHGVYVCRWG